MQISHFVSAEPKSRIIILIVGKNASLNNQFIIDFGYECTNTACSNTEKPFLKPFSQSAGYDLKFIRM